MMVWKHRPTERLVEEAARLIEGGEVDRAAWIWQHIVERHPNNPDALITLGTLRGMQGRYEAASKLLTKAVAIRPNSAGTHYNLGLALLAQRLLPAADASFRRAIEIDPTMVNAFGELGRVLEERKQWGEALQAYTKAVELDPSSQWLSDLVSCQRSCGEWQDLDDRVRVLIERLTASQHPISPLLCLNVSDDPAIQKRNAAAYFSHYHGRQGAVQTPIRQRRESKKIRLGYLSNDFQEHATSYLIAELIETHDRERFDVLGFSYGRNDGGPMRTRLKRGFDKFFDLEADSSASIAKLIVKQGIDVLIDLKGYTKGAKVEVLAHRPAPIQVHYLGFPGTLMCPWVDYLIVDPYVVPPSYEAHYGEALCFLPHCYQVNDRKRAPAGLRPQRADFGLPDDAFVFCGFHNLMKITPEMFAIWVRILSRVPRSILWLLERDQVCSERLRSIAELEGVTADRIVFAPQMSLAHHLDRLVLADLYLDTLPYNAHTTASDALWMGLPVLTCSGQSFAGRVAGSLLHAVGVPELITIDIGQYEDKAVELALTPSLMGPLRAALAAGRQASPLFDTPRFCSNIEAAYSQMWSRFKLGEKPSQIRVSDMISPLASS